MGLLWCSCKYRCIMLGNGKNCSKGSTILPSETPYLPLHLDPITLGNQKSSRTGELRRVLRISLGSTSEGRAFGGDQNGSASSGASEELKHFKESVQDSSKKACDRAKMFGQSISKLDRIADNLSSKKRQRSDVLSSERCAINLEKMGNQLHGSTRDPLSQRMEQKPKSAGLVKRFRTAVADGQADSKLTVVPRQPAVKDKREEKFPVGNAVPNRIEAKICGVPTGGDGWEKKIKRKRSVSAVGSRVMNSNVNSKQVLNSESAAGTKQGSSSGPDFRSKSSSGFGMNKLNCRYESSTPNASTLVRSDQEAASSPKNHMDMLGQRVLLKGNKSNNREDELNSASPSLLIRGKISRAPRTGPITVLDSSTTFEPSHGGSGDLGQPSNVNKIIAADVGTEKIHSASHPMTKWGGQRTHKKSRLRRAYLLSPVTNHSEIQSSPQGFSRTELGFRSPLISNEASLPASNVNKLKSKKELEKVPSPADASESEESGAFHNGQKGKAVDGCGVVLTTSHDIRGSSLPTKHKIPNCETDEGVRKQGRSGRGLLTRPVGQLAREKPDDLILKPPQNVRPSTDRNKSKSGRPAMKKLKDRKGLLRVGSVLESGSPEFMGELDDHETLVAAANYTRNALNQACSNRFWKKMESLFASLSNDDVSFLKKQLSLAEELDEGLSLIFGIDCETLEVPKYKDDSDKKQGNALVQASVKRGPLCDKFDTRGLRKIPSMFERLVSALIDDENEEAYLQIEGKNLSPHVSDDSHCGSCNQMDIDSKDRERIESEVESAIEQNQKLCLLDRLSCNKGGTSSTLRNSGMSTSGYSNEQSFGDDDYSHVEMSLVSEICSSDIVKLQQNELYISGFPFPDEQYHLRDINDRIILELRSIDLCPETLPDLAEEGLISDSIIELKEKLYEKVNRIRKRLERLDKATVCVREIDRRKVEEMAMNKTVEMAYKRRMACRGINPTKTSVRRVPNQIASAFTKRTLARYKKFEETGISSFREPALQDILFAHPAGKSDAKFVDCVGSGTASNTLNEAFKYQADAKKSGANSSTPRPLDSGCENMANPSSKQNYDKLVSLKVTSAFDIKSTAISEHQTKSKTKQRLKRCNRSCGNFNSPSFTPNPTSGNSIQPLRVAAATSVLLHPEKEKQEGEAIDLDKLALDEHNEQDLGSLLNFDVDGLQDCFTAGLEEPPWDDFSSVMIL
ncbi:hypothetical protein SAY87_019510 [Trapa incisa]|uniref:Uncharacterized protein n=1 Tax=Trapa incisa TaxID=236973 RepID=A0AAN7Q314_9MYRT|nr:hypothetical protein SAY87_019510 [Trapa incisa]